MMDETIDAVAGSTVRPEWAVPADRSGPTNELGKDEFLQLLVAQLKYQDPLEPTSSDQFIATTAQFTVVEKLDELTKQGANSALITSLTTAGNLVGREVTANRDGVPVTAVVERSRIASGQVVLETARGEISLNQIVSIGSPSAVPVPADQAGSVVPVGPTSTIEGADQGTAVDREPGGASDQGFAPAATDDLPDDLAEAFLDEETAAAAGYGPDIEAPEAIATDSDGPAAADASVEYVDGVGFVEVVGGSPGAESLTGVPIVQQVEPVQVIQPLVILGVPENAALSPAPVPVADDDSDPTG
jgi:flagellar basal-body rod modification protein FlgD